MNQYIKANILMPKGLTWAEFEKELKKRGFKVKTTGVFLQLKIGNTLLPVPKEFDIK
jgi:hypothetical protein